MIKKHSDKWIADDWLDLFPKLSTSKLGLSRNIKIKDCPSCEELGKSNSESVSIIPADGYGHCHKCGTKFLIRESKSETTKRVEYTPPSRKNITSLQEDGLQFLVNRKISQDVANRYKLAQRNSEVAFPYIQDGECVNIKYRNIHEKKFSQSGGGKHVVFGYDQAKEYMEASGDFRVLICEGEADTLSYATQGINFAVSVDSGAINERDTKIDGKLECIDNSQYLFDLADIIYIATDNDSAGHRLRDELIRRFDIDKVRVVDYGDYKDANEAHMYDVSLSTLLDTAKEVKIDGIFYAEDVKDKLKSVYDHGLPKGEKTHLPSIDGVDAMGIWSWRRRDVTIWTGYNNEGKSNFLTYLAMLKAAIDGDRFAYYSPENSPAEEFFEDLMHMFIGKTMDKDFAGRMTPKEFERAYEFVNDRFFLIYPDKEKTVENIFMRAANLVKKKGIKHLILDPYNTIEHNQGSQREDLYISTFMGSLKSFAIAHDISIQLVAHQNKPERKNEDLDYPAPDIYKIKGGGTFADKADNVLSVWRPYRRSEPTNPLVTIESHRIRKKKLTGTIGKADFTYEWQSNRYQDELLNGVCPLDQTLMHA